MIGEKGYSLVELLVSLMMLSIIVYLTYNLFEYSYSGFLKWQQNNESQLVKSMVFNRVHDDLLALEKLNNRNGSVWKIEQQNGEKISYQIQSNKLLRNNKQLLNEDFTVDSLSFGMMGIAQNYIWFDLYYRDNVEREDRLYLKVKRRGF